MRHATACTEGKGLFKREKKCADRKAMGGWFRERNKLDSLRDRNIRRNGLKGESGRRESLEDALEGGARKSGILAWRRCRASSVKFCQ